MKTFKRVFFGALILFIPYFIYKEYIEYIRFAPPSDYDFPISAEVDLQYHDPSIVEKYLASAQKVGQIARSAWYEHQVDVRMMGETPDAAYASYIQTYNQAKTSAIFMEKKLLFSAKCKKLGFTNAQIQQAEALGVADSEYFYALAQARAHTWGTEHVLKNGMNNIEVMQIQTLLKKLGYDLPIDGYFENITKQSVERFQKENGVFVTGVVNDVTLAEILKKSMGSK
jgi:hypothetical protein